MYANHNKHNSITNIKERCEVAMCMSKECKTSEQYGTYKIQKNFVEM